MARSHSPLEQGSGKPNSTQEHDAAREVTGASGPISRQSERVEDRHPRMSLEPGYIFLILRFARRFVAQGWWFWFAVLLFFASTPVLTASLVLFSGIQLLVFAAMLAILESYFLYEDTGCQRYLVWLSILLLIGPWLRE